MTLKELSKKQPLTKKYIKNLIYNTDRDPLYEVGLNLIQGNLPVKRLYTFCSDSMFYTEDAYIDFNNFKFTFKGEQPVITEPKVFAIIINNN